MASIGPVNLRIFENASGTALIQVGYTISATHHDAFHERAYREVVQLIGDDTPAVGGEDGGGATSSGEANPSPEEEPAWADRGPQPGATPASLE